MFIMCSNMLKCYVSIDCLFFIFSRAVREA